MTTTTENETEPKHGASINEVVELIENLRDKDFTGQLELHFFKSSIGCVYIRQRLRPRRSHKIEY